MNEIIENINRHIYKRECFVKGGIIPIFVSILITIYFYLELKPLGFITSIMIFYTVMGYVIYKLGYRMYKQVPNALRLTDERLEIIYENDVKSLEWDKILDCTPSKPWIIRLKDGEKLDLKTVDKEIITKVYPLWKEKKRLE